MSDQHTYLTGYCFVCRRATDHTAEHEALRLAGMAGYEASPTTGENYVVRTDRYEAELAWRVQDAEYTFLYGSDAGTQVLALRKVYEELCDQALGNQMEGGTSMRSRALFTQADQAMATGISLVLGEDLTTIARRPAAV